MSGNVYYLSFHAYSMSLLLLVNHSVWSIWGESTFYVITFYVHKSFGTQLNDIRNWASLIGLLFRICWCLLSIFLIYCSDEWKKLVNLIYCFQVLFRMNFKIMYFLMKILGNTPSANSAASRDSLSSQNATWGIVFFSSFYWWHIEYKGWMCERLLNLQEIYVSGQNICIEVYGNSVGTITPYWSYLNMWPIFL